MKVSIDEKVIKEEVELKPCPFCGSEHLEFNYDFGSYGYTQPVASITCLECGTTISRSYSNVTHRELKLATVKAWNKRKIA